MFVDVLTREEQTVFCQLAYLVMAADGQVGEKERAFYDRSLRDLQLEELPGPPSGGELVLPEGLFRTAASRHALLLELALLAASDGSVSPEERELLDSVADGIGVDLSQIETYVAYASRLRATLDEGTALIAEGH